MSLPNYLASIKSAGFYRFVWDKSQMPAETAQTMRLVVGYSEKGPFNTPVYVDKVSDFKAIFGGINKKLERRGVYFHRLALQALAYGPILALNIKPFNKDEKVSYVSTNRFTGDGKLTGAETTLNDNYKIVTELYNTNRFWKLEPDDLLTNSTGYINIAMTDSDQSNCTIFVRDYTPEQGWDITIEDYFANLGEEMPDEYALFKSKRVSEAFGEVYIFKDNFFNNGNNAKYLKNGVILKSVTNAYGLSSDTLEAAAADPFSGFIDKYQGCLLPNFKDANGKYISLDMVFNQGSSEHKMLMKFNEDKLGNALGDVNDFYPGSVKGSWYVGNTEETDVVGAPIAYYMQGYTYASDLDKENKKLSGQPLQERVLSVLTSAEGEGIRTALTNHKDVDYHYIVDTFETYPGSGMKEVFTMLCKEKQNAFAILNFPKMKSIIDDDKCNGVTNKFDIKLLPSKYSLPTDINGASYGAFFTQLVISDGTVKTTIPSAALVSNNFMEKWNSRQPYYIVAGPNYGRMQENGLVGPDYNFGRSDLDVLEPMGVNAMVYVPRKGTYINSNQTAKQTPVSALSKIHIRELVIYLQNEIETMLSNYQWELNTQALRDVVKAKADAILETVKNNGGVYAYINICDETNNTPLVIDNEMIVLSTEIEPARGAGKMVQEITIHRTGGLTVK